MRAPTMRARMTLAFVFILAPFLLLSSHIVITLVHNRHLNAGRGYEMGWQPFLLLTTAAMAAFAVGAWLLVGRTLSPIRALAHQAASARAEDPGVRLVAPSPDGEMQELVETLNDFLGRMQEASAEKGRFYAAASHELRTPLQALSGHLEVALSQPRTQAEYEAALQEALTQTQRLTSLVEGILLLHHLQGQAPIEKDAVAMDEVIREILEGLEPLMEARELQLTLHLSPVEVSAVPTHAAIIARNLLENAAKYGHLGGCLEVTLREQTLTIENDAPDGPLDVARLLEPFYRLDASRSTKSGGNGLGLAICQAVAQANGWSLTLSAEKGKIVAMVSGLRAPS